MKKRFFWFVVFFFISLTLICYTIGLVTAAVGFFMSLISFIDIKFSLIPPKNHHFVQNIKPLFYRLNKLEQYRKFCIAEFWVAFSIGILGIVLGITDIWA